MCTLSPLSEAQQREIEGVTQEFRSIFLLLMEDLKRAIDQAKSCDDAYFKRTLTRTFFPCVEGISFQLRECALAYANIRPNTFSQPYSDVLHRRSGMRINDIGQPVSGKKCTPPDMHALLFRMRLYGLIYHIDFEPDVGEINNPSRGWKAMLSFKDRRDDLMHPKSCEDLNITGYDETNANCAAQWFKDEFARLIKLTNKRAEEINLNASYITKGCFTL